ncbi:hypothetical protein SRABI106_02738 [Rahnella aquatilis]|nr:hypothetical protein SRABI106_02738 [Rahnella aquatilis]
MVASLPVRANALTVKRLARKKVVIIFIKVSLQLLNDHHEFIFVTFPNISKLTKFCAIAFV